LKHHRGGWRYGLALALAAGCAQVEPPPGGPDLRQPTAVIAVVPDSVGALPPGRAPVVVRFNAPLSERGVEEAVLVSPRTSSPRTERRGSELRVSLAEGWEPGRIYHVTVLPEIRDRFGNRLERRVELYLTTGPELPDTRLSGTVVDRITGRPERGARVEAIRLADSLVYALPSDSAGEFHFRRLPEGDYRVRAYVDRDRSRTLDPWEARDTARLAVRPGDTARAALRLVEPDTTAPVLAGATGEGRRIEARFDDHLDPLVLVSPTDVQVVDSLGRPIPVGRVAVGELSETAPGSATADTAAADAVAPPPPAAAARPTAQPREPLPSRSLLVETAEPLEPDTEYRLEVRAVTNVVGLTGGGTATFRTPSAPVPPPEPDDDPEVPDAPGDPSPDPVPDPPPVASGGPSGPR
jgi:hypothetical protein